MEEAARTQAAETSHFPRCWHAIHRRRLPRCPTAARLNRDPKRPYADFAQSGYLQTSRPHFSSVRRARCHADAEPRTLPQGALDGVAADIVGAGVELGIQQRLRVAKMVLLRVAGSRCGSSAILCRVLPGGEFLNLNDAATGHLRLRLGKAGFFFAALSPPIASQKEHRGRGLGKVPGTMTTLGIFLLLGKQRFTQIF